MRGGRIPPSIIVMDTDALVSHVAFGGDVLRGGGGGDGGVGGGGGGGHHWYQSEVKRLLPAPALTFSDRLCVLLTDLSLTHSLNPPDTAL